MFKLPVRPGTGNIGIIWNVTVTTASVWPATPSMLAGGVPGSDTTRDPEPHPTTNGLAAIVRSIHISCVTMLQAAACVVSAGEDAAYSAAVRAAFSVLIAA